MSDASDRPGRRPYPRTSSPDAGTPRPDRCVRGPGCVLTSRAVGAADRVAVTGELTMATRALLDAEVAEVCRRERDRVDLVLDLTDVTVLDVVGLAALRRAHERATAQGRIRLGLPAATAPSRLIRVAVEHHWLAPAFRPATPAL